MAIDRKRRAAWWAAAVYHASQADSYDADAQAYITAAGELFPDALNTLVVGMKAAGVWSKLDTFKKAIGVPSLSASMIDLRNTAFNGTAVNNPGQSATTGWDFVQASSQYIDDPWGPGVVGALAGQNDAHIGRRVTEALNAGGSFGRTPGRALAGSSVYFGFMNLEPGYQNLALNDGANLFGGTVRTGHFIATRSGTARALYRNGSSAGSDTSASTGNVSQKVPIGAASAGGSISAFFTGKITVAHGGTGLDATEAAALTTLIDTYATAAGEA